MSAWDDDVAEALRCAQTGVSQNWPVTARTLAAEISELRSKLIDKLVEDFKRCPRCDRLADEVIVREGKPTVYWHGGTEHLDLSTEIKAVRNGG